MLITINLQTEDRFDPPMTRVTVLRGDDYRNVTVLDTIVPSGAPNSHVPAHAAATEEVIKTGVLLAMAVGKPVPGDRDKPRPLGGGLAA